MATLKVNTLSGIGTEGPVLDGGLHFRSESYMTLPKGDTTQRGRGRGIVGGGSPGTDNNEQIEFINIQSDGVVTEFGELIQSRRGCGGCSSSTRGWIGGGTAGHSGTNLSVSNADSHYSANGGGIHFNTISGTDMYASPHYANWR